MVQNELKKFGDKQISLLHAFLRFEAGNEQMQVDVENFCRQLRF